MFGSGRAMGPAALDLGRLSLGVVEKNLHN